MMKRLFLLICFTAILLTLVLSGCNDNSNHTSPTKPAVSIVLTESIPSATIGASYDLSAIVNTEDDVKYTYSATYVDPETKQNKELAVVRGKFTPKVEADISVTVTAVRGEESSSIQFTIPISVSADIVDSLLVSDGINDGLTKVITKDSSSLHGDTSTSSVTVTFTNGNYEIFNLSHYALQAYYSARVWHNAAVSFWVYNPMEQDVAFKLVSHNPETGTTLLWDSNENTQTQVANANAWTHVVFSLYDMGITQPLLDNPTYPREDSLKTQKIL